MSKEIIIPNRRSLEDLIQVNLKRTISAVPIGNPQVSAVVAGKDKLKELEEALEYAAGRYTASARNRFAAIELGQDNALSQAMSILADFIQKAQRYYDSECNRVDGEFALKDKLRADANKLLHSRKIKKAVDALREATIEIVERLDEVGSIRIDDVLDSDVYTDFAMQAIRKLHRGDS